MSAVIHLTLFEHLSSTGEYHRVAHRCALTSSGLSLQIQTQITCETAPVTLAVIL